MEERKNSEEVEYVESSGRMPEPLTDESPGKPQTDHQPESQRMLPPDEEIAPIATGNNEETELVNEEAIIEDEQESYEKIKTFLEDKRKQFQKEGNFREAEGVAKRLRELNIRYLQRKKDILKVAHREELETIDLQFGTEMQNLKRKWKTEIFPNFQSECEIQERELQEKQSKEVEEFKSNQKLDRSLHYKTSSKVIQLKKRLEQLGNLSQYKDAKKLEKEIKNEEVLDKQKYQNAMKTKLHHRSQLILKKHEKEYVTLLDKQKTKLNAAKEEEIAILLKRFEHHKGDMQIRYKKHLNKIKRDMEIISPKKHKIKKRRQ